MRIVRDDGSRDARIVVVGEQPGKTENDVGRPFVGPAGMKLNRWIEQAGASRRDVYITNVVPYFRAAKLKGIDKQEIEFWTRKLHERLDALRDPQVIVPLGNAALRAVLGPARTYDKRSKTRLTIGKARGFLFDADLAGRIVRAIPTIHPAAIFRDPSAERACELDWQKIVREAERTISRPLTFRHNTRPSLRTVNDWVDEAIAQGGPVSLDIETVSTPRTIMCIGMSWDGRESYVVPLDDRRYWPAGTVRESVWRAIARLLASPVEKILQSGFYDAFWLARIRGLRLTNWRWDLRWMHHCWLPQDYAHDLAYMASTELPLMRYWKDEAKNAEESQKYASDFDALQSYCGTDNCVQRRLFDVLRARLAQRGRLDFYLRHYADLLPALLEIMVSGVPVDRATRRDLSESVTGEACAAAWEAERAAGVRLVAEKKIADARLAKVLYGAWELRKYRSKEGALTVNEVALRKLMLRYPRRADVQRLLGAVLEHRRKFQLSLFVRGERVDEDDRQRCAYGFTETLRLTSSESPFGTGSNTQNIDRDVRGMYRALLGHVLIELDQSTAESRIVKILTGAPRLIELALTQPWEFDDHANTATIIYGVALGSVDKTQRYFAKRVNHASNYDMRGLKMSEEILKDGVVITPEECDRLLEAKHAADPEVRRWHAAVKREVLREEKLVNSWGWEWTLEGRLLCEAAYREAYAFIPQSEVGMLTNEFGVKPLARVIAERGLGTRILMQNHDSLVLSAPPSEAWRVVQFVRASMGREREYGMPRGPRTRLAMPIEIKVGARWDWKGGVEWKKPPGREEFEAAVARAIAQQREENGDGEATARVERQDDRVRTGDGIPGDRGRTRRDAPVGRRRGRAAA